VARVPKALASRPRQWWLRGAAVALIVAVLVSVFPHPAARAANQLGRLAGQFWPALVLLLGVGLLMALTAGLRGPAAGAIGARGPGLPLLLHVALLTLAAVVAVDAGVLLWMTMTTSRSSPARRTPRARTPVGEYVGASRSPSRKRSFM
jgi:hypothetical protein